MIKFDKVSKVYDEDADILTDISFEIKEGEFVCIVGKSGAGKTTITKMILGLETPTTGKVFFKDINVEEATSDELQKIRRNVGAVYQDHRLLPNKTVYENVSYIMQVEGKSNKEISEEVPKVLEVIGLQDKMNNFPSEISGGEKQRLAIARAIVNHPQVIIADEPTGNLDPYNSYEVMTILQKINATGRTVLLATHDRDLVNKLNERVITLENGRVIRDEEKGKFML